MDLARCIYNCIDDQDCEADCVNHFKVVTENCPCEVNHMLFLKNLIRVKKNCPGGCPCSSYECEDISSTINPTTISEPITTTAAHNDAVLVLSTYSDEGSENVPMVIQFNGECWRIFS